MKYYPLLEGKTVKGIFALYLTAMLFLSRDTLFSSSIVGFAKSQMYMLVLIGLLGVWFLIRNYRNLKQILVNPRILVFVIFAVALLIPMLVKRDWQLMYFSILLCPLFAVFLTYFTTARDISKYYVVILCVLGAYSVVASYGLRDLALAGKLNPQILSNSNQAEFYNFIFAYAAPLAYWHRNFGIFREPGVYQFFVLLALYLNNYLVNWNKNWKMWLCNVILVITMISTFAIGGFVELGLFAVFLFVDKKLYREKWGRIACAAVMLGVVSFIAYYFYRMSQPHFEHTMLFELYDMSIRLFTKSESSTDRLDAIITNLEFLAKKPLLGDMIGNVLHGTNHNTSSTLVLYAMLGIFGGTLNVAAWVALAWKRERSLFGNLVLLMILFMSFNTQNLTANVFFWLFPTMALVERGLPLIAKKE